MKEQHQCAKNVYHPHSFSGYPCKKRGVVLHDGKWWCNVHSPEGRAKREAQVSARWEQQKQQWQQSNAKKENLRKNYGIMKTALQIISNEAPTEAGTIAMQALREVEKNPTA